MPDQKHQDKNKENKLILVWDNLEKYISIFILLSMSLITLIQVFTRHLLGFSLIWSEEIARFLLVALTYVGSAYAFRKNVHVSVEAFTNILPDKIAYYIEIFSKIVSVIFFALVGFYGYHQAISHFGRITPATRIPMTIPYMALPIGAVLIVLRLSVMTYNDIKSGYEEERR